MIEINCDLGEGESRQHTQALMRHLDAANIACGGHAGDDDSMAACLQLARQEGVLAGAHPGFPNRTDFGREVPADFNVSDLRDLLDHQVGRLTSIARDASISIRHIKLHGALYHLVDQNPLLGNAYLDHVARRWPRLIIMSRSGGDVSRRAGLFGLRVLAEGFLDRAYRNDGSLLPRGENGAVLDDPTEAIRRCQLLLDRGSWPSVDGTWIPMAAETLCIHGDSPGSLRMLEKLREKFPRRA